MNKTGKIILGVVVVVVVVGLFYWGFTHNNQATGPATGEPIKIGFIAPLSGDASSYGFGEKNAVEMALAEINQNGGVIGQPIEVIYEDGKCNGKDAVTAAQKLMEIDNVKIILGGGCSGETLAIAPVTEEKKVILFSAFSSNPSISQAGDFVFRNMMSDKDIAEATGISAVNDGYKKIAILSENTDYAQGVRKNMIAKLKNLGAEIVADEIYATNAKDFRTQLTKIKAANPEAIIFDPQASVAAGLSVKQSKEMGLNLPYYGVIAFSSPEALSIGGEALNGLKFTDAPGLVKSNPKAQKFLENYLAQYPQPSSDYDIGARYDSVYLMAEAIKSCKKVDSECIKNYLYNLPEYKGVIGNYHFDQNGDSVGLKTAALKVVKDAKAGIVEEIQ